MLSLDVSVRAAAAAECAPVHPEAHLRPKRHLRGYYTHYPIPKYKIYLEEEKNILFLAKRDNTHLHSKSSLAEP